MEPVDTSLSAASHLEDAAAGRADRFAQGVPDGAAALGALAAAEARRTAPEAMLVSSDLLGAVPPPVAPTLAELRAAFESQRFIVVRLGGGVSWGVLVAVGGALLIHLFLVAIFVVSFYLIIPYMGRGQHDEWALRSHEGGSSSGGLVMAGTPEGNPGARVAALAPEVGPVEPTAELTAPEITLPTPRPVQQVLRPDEGASDLIALAGGGAMVGDMNGPRSRAVAVPRMTTKSAAPAGALVALMPPLAPTALAHQPLAAGPTGQRGRPGGRGKTITDGNEGDGEAVINIMNPGVGDGTGSGGRGTGSGIDRGASGADLASPMVLEVAHLVLPENLQAKVIGKKIVFDVEVLADGSVGRIALVESSGTADIDAMCRATLAKYKFRPAYDAGKAVARTMRIGWDG